MTMQNKIFILIKNNIKRYKDNGMLSILSVSIINKFIGLLLSVIIVRIVSKYSYGLYAEASNTCSLFLIFSGFGIKNGILQFCSEERLNKKSLYKFGIIFGTTANLLLSILLYVYAMCGGMSTEDGKKLLLMMTVVPITQFVNEYGLVWLRTKLDNKVYAKATNINSLSNLLFTVIGVYFIGVYGCVLGQILSSITTIYYIYVVRGRYFQWKEIFLNNIHGIFKENDTKNLIIFSLICTITNAFSSLLVYLDIFVLGKMFRDPTILAAYKASSTIPEAAKFLTATVITCIYPIFVLNNKNVCWLKKSMLKLSAFLLLMNSTIALIMFFGASKIILIIYGEQYLDAIPVFKILSIAFLVATVVRMPFGNILLMLREEKFNFWLAVISGSLNVVLDIVLIKKYASIGAAIATLSVVVLTSLMSLGRVIWKIKKIASSK